MMDETDITASIAVSPIGLCY